MVEYIDGLGDTRIDSVSVGTSNVMVATTHSEANPRKVICLRNVSANPIDIIYLASGNGSPLTNGGIKLNLGESVIDASDGGYTCAQGQWIALCATANGVLSIYER